jgi:hypothetical protein
MLRRMLNMIIAKNATGIATKLWGMASRRIFRTLTLNKGIGLKGCNEGDETDLPPGTKQKCASKSGKASGIIMMLESVTDSFQTSVCAVVEGWLLLAPDTMSMAKARAMGVSKPMTGNDVGRVVPSWSLFTDVCSKQA